MGWAFGVGTESKSWLVFLRRLRLSTRPSLRVSCNDSSILLTRMYSCTFSSKQSSLKACANPSFRHSRALQSYCSAEMPRTSVNTNGLSRMTTVVNANESIKRYLEDVDPLLAQPGFPHHLISRATLFDNQDTRVALPYQPPSGSRNPAGAIFRTIFDATPSVVSTRDGSSSLLGKAERCGESPTS